MQDMFIPSKPVTLDEWELSIELARSFLPNDPMNAWERLTQLQRDLQASLALSSEPSPELQELGAYVATLADEAHAAAQRYQHDSAQRSQHFHTREINQPILH